MRVAPECFPCFARQIEKTGRISGASDGDIRKIIEEFNAVHPPVCGEVTPAELGGSAYRLLSRATGVRDPYGPAKSESIRKALALYPAVKAMVEASEDRLLAAAKAAIAGNVIDFGIPTDSDPIAGVEKAIHLPLTIDDHPEFKRRLGEARSVLYLADNAGETVFDRVLIEELGQPVTYAVRESPIINDALAEDAESSGIGAVARIVSSGCSTPGTIRKFCSPEFLEILDSADLIISKGQGNYEGLSDELLPVFFLLMAKCEPVARDLGVPLGSLVLFGDRQLNCPNS
ncbi:MAG: hypothetical protein A2Y56_06100 [Candidatus Aminicenantes bacterium RBG_13_63_10]|nr:MAG: hypothetical protein A2Y56_06100 [Candidatus Aminicenantes bacterium RBG_13_63_10]